MEVILRRKRQFTVNGLHDVKSLEESTQRPWEPQIPNSDKTWNSRKKSFEEKFVLIIAVFKILISWNGYKINP
jgi:hypothetical protein